MRISEELEKELARLEEENSEHSIKLLDVAYAFECAYSLINSSILADETDFRKFDDELLCSKERYDGINSKTIYTVTNKDESETFFNIEVSNLGGISWVINSSNQAKSEELIQKINRPNSPIMQELKMNADLSFFSQNRELVLSSKPYIALKMGNFLEGDKAVLVYKEESSQNEMNKVNGGIKYIRVDQIEGYLKNIKVDERKIPALAYSYLGRDYFKEAMYEKNYLEKELHLDMDENVLEKLKSSKHEQNVIEAAITIGATGLIAGGIGGALIGGLVFSAGLIGGILGAGIPIATATAIYKKQMKKIDFARNRDIHIEESKISLYKKLKEYANENIVSFEQEFTRKRTKQQKKNIKLEQNLSVTEIINILRKNLLEERSIQSKFYNLALSQIINAYSIEPTTEAEKIKRDAELYNDLIQISEEISDMENQSYATSCNKSLDIIREKLDQGDNNLTIQILSKFDQVLSPLEIPTYENKDGIVNELQKTYLEALVNGSYQENGLSVETIAEIPSSTRYSLLRRLTTFGRRMQEFVDADKLRGGNTIISIENSNDYTEIKLIKAINIVKNNNLEFDLLGKVPQAKVKTK